MNILSRALCALLLLSTVQGLHAQSLPTPPAGLAIERVAVLPAEPTSITLVPSSFEGEFGAGLIVTTDGDSQDRTVPDVVYHVDPTYEIVTPLISLVGEADPIGSDWYEAGSFDRGLYISLNNRDGYLPRDQGGTVTRLNVQMGVAVETLFAPPGTYSEPNTAAFAPAGSPYGDLLYVANASDPPYAVLTTDAAGTTNIFRMLPNRAPKVSLGFGRGGLFGETLYTTDRTGEVVAISAGGSTLSRWSTGVEGFGTPNFAPAGLFRDHIYITSAGGTMTAPEGQITRIDASGNASTWMSGFSPFSTDHMRDYIAFSEDGRFLYVVDPGTRSVYRIGAPRLAITQPLGPGTVDVQLSGFVPGELYYVAYSFDAANNGPMQGLGPAFGLFIDGSAILSQLAMPFIPVVGMLDANGAVSFGSSAPSIMAGLSGMQLSAVAVTFGGSSAMPVITDRSAVANLTFL